MPLINAVFMGSEDFSLPILRALMAHGSEGHTRLVGVVTQPDRPSGRGRKVAMNPVRAFASQQNIPVLQPERLRSDAAVADVLALEPDLVVVASYGQIIPKAVLDAPAFQCLNLHPSLLPLYRGASPVSAPILDGANTTGTTLMLMRSSMDAGPILDQMMVDIRAGETAGELEARLADVSAAILMKSISSWIDGSLQPREQDEAQATYTARLAKEDGAIDWTQSAQAISRRVRAFNPWPTAFTFWNADMIRILRAHDDTGDAVPGQVLSSGTGPLYIGTGRGLLAVDELQIAGGRRLSAAEFLRGHARFHGSVLGEAI